MGAARIYVRPAMADRQGDAEVTTLQAVGQAGQHARNSTRHKQVITVISTNKCDEDRRFDTRQSGKVGQWNECCFCFVDLLAGGILVRVPRVVSSSPVAVALQPACCTRSTTVDSWTVQISLSNFVQVYLGGITYPGIEIPGISITNS